MSDSWFIGTVSRIHYLERFARHAKSDIPYLRQVAEMEKRDQSSDLGEDGNKYVLKGGSPNTPVDQPKRGVGMMVSLDHVIYFHRPREVKADEWILSEMESPWSGEGRGLVMQRIWNKQGRLLATCVQEVSLLLRDDDTILMGD